jgi:hypothetical protein
VADTDFTDTIETKDETPDAGVNVDDASGDEEKLGAQALRRQHERLAVILQEDNDALELIEEEGVKDHIEESLKDVVAAMEAIEALWSEKYEADYGPLDNAPEESEEDSGEKSMNDESDTMDESAEVADSSRETPIDPAETVEGMRTRSVGQFRTKAAIETSSGSLTPGVSGDRIPNNPKERQSIGNSTSTSFLKEATGDKTPNNPKERKNPVGSNPGGSLTPGVSGRRQPGNDSEKYTDDYGTTCKQKAINPIQTEVDNDLQGGTQTIPDMDMADHKDAGPGQVGCQCRDANCPACGGGCTGSVAAEIINPNYPGQGIKMCKECAQDALENGFSMGTKEVPDIEPQFNEQFDLKGNDSYAVLDDKDEDKLGEVEAKNADQAHLKAIHKFGPLVSIKKIASTRWVKLKNLTPEQVSDVKQMAWWLKDLEYAPNVEVEQRNKSAGWHKQVTSILDGKTKKKNAQIPGWQDSDFGGRGSAEVPGWSDSDFPDDTDVPGWSNTELAKLGKAVEYLQSLTTAPNLSIDQKAQANKYAKAIGLFCPIYKAYQDKWTGGFEIYVSGNKCEVRKNGQTKFSGTQEECEQWLKERGERSISFGSKAAEDATKLTLTDEKEHIPGEEARDGSEMSMKAMAEYQSNQIQVLNRQLQELLPKI